MNVRNIWRSENEHLSQICCWDVGRENKGFLWAPHPTFPLTSSSHVRRNWSYHWFRWSFLGPGLSWALFPSRWPSREELAFAGLAAHTPCLLCPAASWPSPLRVVDGMPGSTKGSGPVAAWGWFAGAGWSISQTQGKTRTLCQCFVAELCTHALFIKGFLTWKLAGI